MAQSPFMPTRSLRLLTLVLVLVSFACNRSAVELEFTNAEKEVQPLQNLVFRFSQPLVPDSLLNRWDSSAFVRFEPAIPGRFRWESPSQLVFSPARPLAPATEYTASFSGSLLAHSRFRDIKTKGEISFHTPLLKLESGNISWVLPDEQSNQAIAQLDLQMNYKVDPALFREKLQLSLDGKPVAFSLVTASADSRVSLRLPTLKASDRDLELELRLLKGLLPEAGSIASREDMVSRFTLPSPFVLVVNSIETEHDGTTGKVYLKTSQQPDPASLAGLVKIEPAIRFSTEVTEDGLLISSDLFSTDKSYQLILEKGLRGRIGGVLREDYENNIAFGQLEPSIRFVSDKAAYLSGQGARNLELKIVNVPKVKVVVSRIYENNLLAAANYGYYPKESGTNEYYYEEGGDFVPGDIIYEKEIETRSLPKAGNGFLFQLNLEDRIPEFRGSYHVRVRSVEDYWISDNRFVSLSDIGLVVKEGRDRIFVFANSIKTTASMKDVNVVVYGANNQVLGLASTNEEGVAEVAVNRRDMAGFRPAMVIAKTAGDFNYLLFRNSAVNTSRFGLGGKNLNSTGLDAMVYGERDIYRPGERLNYAVLVRDYKWKSPGAIPVKFKFLYPTGKEMRSFRKNLNSQGSTEGSIDIPVAAITGTYTLEMYSGNDVLLSSTPFSVEEFVPDRIRVTARLSKNVLLPADKAELGINAVSFFGPPAANRPYETEIQVAQRAFSPRKYRQYRFGLTNQNSFFDRKLLEGKMDDNGNASLVYEVPGIYRNIGLLQADFFTTVFDETGRPVSRKSTAEIFTQLVFLGIGDNGYDYFPLNQPVKFPLIALDKSGEPLSNVQAKVELIKREYRTVLSKSGQYFRYESQREDKVVASVTTTVSGENTSYSFVPRSPGNYEIRLSIPGASAYVGREFYSYGYWGGDLNSFEVNTEGEINIESDKESYREGETARLLFKTPFSGKLLVTVEQDRVMSYRYISVEKRSATLDLPLTGEHLPNIYVTATLVKPHEVSDIPLTVAHGFRNITVSDNRKLLPVEILSQESVRSRTRQKVRVKAPVGSLVTLAAVDNGVLQVTDFKTPDPYGHFYATRALAVNAFDLYPLLFPERRATKSSTGGDGALRMDQRINPMPNKRVKILSYWSGIREVNGSGEAVFEFDIPQFSGEVRLMAVAYKDDRFGNAERKMKVADPLVLSTALPRFLSPGDSALVPLTISNTTGKAMKVRAVLRISGPLQAGRERPEELLINANSEVRVPFSITAKQALGAAKLVMEVQGGGEKFAEETEITVRPASTLQKMSSSGVMAANTTRRVDIGVSDFLPAGSRYRLVLSRSPVLELATQLSSLVQYPFGCTEQTISVAFPQLYYGDLAELLHRQPSASASAAANVLEAIRKIKMRQLYNGAITLWDNEGTEHWWTSVYAAHFLIEARRAGFEVDKSLLETLLAYINHRLGVRSTVQYYYNRDQQKKIAPREVAYSLYVLALAGQGNIASMNYYKSRPGILSLDSKYLLAAAFAISGDKAGFRELLPGSFSGEQSVPQSGGSFQSPIRDEAIALNALLEVDPTHAQVPVMARHMVEQFRQKSWHSTQESAFGLLAIGRLAARSAGMEVKADITVNGKLVGRLDNNTVRLDDKTLGGHQPVVTTKGRGQLYYWWESEGISRSGTYREEDNFLKIRRRYFDRNGRPVTGNRFRQNDLVVVQLVLEKSYSGPVENIVLTDLLPAGFEIENPRTREIPGMDWIRDAATPVSMDIRDDRIHLFVDADKNRQVYYYAVRAVSPGVFQVGPASADAMYNSEYHSYHGAGKIVVED